MCIEYTVPFLHHKIFEFKFKSIIRVLLPSNFLFISGLVLVSDAVAAQGLADGNYRIGPQHVTVEDGRAYVTGTKVLCGSTAALDACVATFKQSLGKIYVLM